MGTRDKRVAENKKFVEELPETLTGVEMIMPDGSIETVELKKGVSKSGKSHFYTVIHDEFDEGQIKMFFPQMGEAGFVPTEDEVRKLLIGEKVRCEKLVSNAGKEYKMEFSFSPFERDSGSNGKEMPFMGLWEKDFAN